MIPNSRDRINRRHCTPMTTNDGRLRFVCNCPSYTSNPMPEPSMTWNYYGSSQTLVFTTCKIPAMQIYYRPFNCYVFSNFRPAALHARLDRVHDTDCFFEKTVEHLNDSTYPLVYWIIPFNRCLVSLLISLILTCLRICNMLAYHWPLP